MNRLTGFSLIEVVISGALIATTIGALFAVSAMGTRLTTLGQDRLIASELAREGIEIVRQVRDANYVSDTQLTCLEGALCGNWRSGILRTQAEAQSFELGTVILFRQTSQSTTQGFVLEATTLSDSNPCGDYIDRETLVVSHSAEAADPYKTFCRRIYLEPVDASALNFQGDTIQDTGKKVVRIRSQVAWLGNGRNSFRGTFSTTEPTLCGGDEGAPTEWCTEQVTLLTEWRPML